MDSAAAIQVVFVFLLFYAMKCVDWPASVASEALDTASGDLSSVGLTGLKVPSPPSLSGGVGSTVAVAIGVRIELRMDGCSITMPLCSWTGR